MNKLIEAINVDRTENGALTNANSGSEVLDFFAKGGAMRAQDDAEVIKMFSRAFAEDRELALKCLFYHRDIRGGNGERRLFRVCLKWLAARYPAVLKKNLHLIEEYGRWDDLLSILDVKDLSKNILDLFADRLNKDMELYASNKPISLLAKWCPSNNTSSFQSRRLASVIQNHLGWTPRQYRKNLVSLRRHLKVVEQSMCAQNWNEIDYEHIPSRAQMLYRKAFRKHDPEGYQEYLDQVENGEKKINSGALYPYDLVGKYFNAYKCVSSCEDQTIELQWKSLPNYLENNQHNGLVICDVSGSMHGDPINVAISLAIYYAERNVGDFQNHFITFSARPQLQKVVGNSLREKIQNLSQADWSMNTNFEAVFDLVLGRAIQNNVPESEMPKVLICVSDLAFDVGGSWDRTTYETLQEKYRLAGYEMPRLVFWNVRTSVGSPVLHGTPNTVLLSGASPSNFLHILQGKTPYDMMMDTLGSERYASLSA